MRFVLVAFGQNIVVEVLNSLHGSGLSKKLNQVFMLRFRKMNTFQENLFLYMCFLLFIL